MSVIVRVLAHHDRQQPAGAGVLVSEGYVVTCAHVVADALGQPRGAADLRDRAVDVDFPLIAGRPRLTATVRAWRPVRDRPVAGEVEDVAVLEISAGALPPGAEPARLLPLDADAFFDRAVRICGFPRGMDEGDWLSGSLQGLTGDGWVQFDGELGRRSVVPGFSGAAVLDKEEGAVAGIVVCVQGREGSTSGYMIPASALIEAWPALDAASRPRNPYRGLRPFREQDAPFFFGRELEIGELAASVTTNTFTAVIGASGSGKSSLVFAGLVPRLRAEGDWEIVCVRPKTDPFGRLAAALIRLLYQDPLQRAKKLEELAGDLAKAGCLRSLVRVIGTDRAGKRLLLVVDQFEELYSLNPSEEVQRRFVDVLIEGAHGQASPPDVSLLLTMRADFMGQALAHAPFAEALDRAALKKMLGPLSADGLRAAIEEPARKLGVRFEAGLSERVQKDVGREPGRLPLLEFALAELWQRQSGRALSHAAYEAIGGVEQALAWHADRIWGSYNAPEQARIRRIFVQLVRPGEGTADTRQVVVREQLRPEDWELVRRLGDARLVVTGRDKEDRDTAELVHESLIQHWPLLQGWMKDARPFRTWQNRLRQDLEAWEASGRRPGALLHGHQLAVAKEKASDYRADLSPRELDFIGQSVKKRKREQVKQLVFAASLVLFFVTTIAAGIWAALSEREAAEQRRLAAEQRRLAEERKEFADQRFAAHVSGKAINFAGNGYVDRGLLLAQEALELGEAPEIRGGLFSILEGNQHLLRYIHDEHRPTDVSFDPNGGGFATAGCAERDDRSDRCTRGEVRLWNREGRFDSFHVHGQEVALVEFDPKGERIASSAWGDPVVWVRNFRTDQVFDLRVNWRPVTSLAFHPRFNWLATGAWGEDVIVLWDLDRKEPMRVIRDQRGGGVNSVAFSSDGKWLAAGYRDGGKIELWRVSDRAPYLAHAREISGHEGTWVHVVAFNKSADLLATGGKDNRILLWDVLTGGRAGALEGHRAWISDLDFTPDGALLISAARDNTLMLWDVAAWKPTSPPLRGHHGPVKSVSVEPLDGNEILSAGEDGKLLHWTIPPRGSLTGRVQGADGHLVWNIVAWPNDSAPVPEAQKDFVSSLSFNSTGTLLAAGTGDGITLWNLDGARSAPLHLDGHETQVWKVAFGTKPHLLASGSADGRIVLWDVGERKQLVCFNHWDLPKVGCESKHKNGKVDWVDWVEDLAFSPNGNTLASATRGHRVALWDIEAKKFDGWLREKEKDVTATTLAFDPTGRFLATAGDNDHLVRIYDLMTQDPPRSYRGPDALIRSLAFSPDGRHLVSASDDQIMIVWDVETGERVRELLGHANWIHGVRFAGDADSPILVSADHSGQVILWDGRSFEQMTLPVQRHNNWVRGIDVSPEGDVLATGDGDGNVFLWSLDIRVWRSQACKVAGRPLTPDEWNSLIGPRGFAAGAPKQRPGVCGALGTASLREAVMEQADTD